MEMGSPVNRQKHIVFTFVTQRMTIADDLAHSLERIGLERRVRDADSVDANPRPDAYARGRGVT
jgi:hypothetical protein